MFKGVNNMICPNCKAEIANDMNFCIKCGTKIETPETESKPEETPIQIPKVVPVQSPAPAKPAEAPQPAAPAQASPVQPAESSGPAESSAADQTAPETSEKHIVCPKCGAQLKEGTKFCTKCGAPVKAASPAPKPESSAPQYSGFASLGSTAPAAPEAPAEIQTPDQGKKNPFSKGLILIILLVIAALIVAILLALKSMGVFSGSGRQDASVSRSDDTENRDDNDDEDEPEEEDPEAAAARAAEIEEIKDQIKASVKAGDASEGISGDYPAALEGYIRLADEYDLAEDISKEADEVFGKYADQVRYSVSLLDGQKVSSGLYIQSRVYYDEILDMADRLEKAGISIQADAIREESDELIDVYRTKYILAINEISSRENWSRDEAWELASDAASITDEDGNIVLFDPDDLDDPLRLRYIYSLAWVTRKHIETGIKDKTMTAEDALDEIDKVLKETDYNLQLIYDGIYYCNVAGIDPTPYTQAFNTIMEKLGENEKILIVLDPAQATETNIDLNHFWAFNDISSGADPDYQVSTTNGTTAETRAWIRENIRINR